jgi:hypothetical protein
VKHFWELIFVALASAVVGGLVSLPVMFLQGEGPFPYSLNSAGVGALIGIAAYLLSAFFYRNLNKNRVLGFALIAAVIGLGTFAGAYFLGLRAALYFGILIFLAEAAGLTMASLGYLRYRKLNEKLRKVQERNEG